MHPGHAGGVFDGAPVGLGPGGDFPDICDQPVGIGAIGAVDFLRQVQMRQPVAVHHDIVAPGDPGDAIGAKADRLIQADEEIQDHEGDDQRIDHGRRDHVAEPDLRARPCGGLTGAQTGDIAGHVDVGPIHALHMGRRAVPDPRPEVSKRFCHDAPPCGALRLEGHPLNAGPVCRVSMQAKAAIRQSPWPAGALPRLADTKGLSPARPGDTVGA